MSELMSISDLEIHADEFTPSFIMDLLIDHAHERMEDRQNKCRDRDAYLRGMTDLIQSFCGTHPGQPGVTSDTAAISADVITGLVVYGRKFEGRNKNLHELHVEV